MPCVMRCVHSHWTKFIYSVCYTLQNTNTEYTALNVVTSEWCKMLAYASGLSELVSVISDFFFLFSRSPFIINSNKDCERKWTKIKVSIKTQHNCTLRSCDDLFLLVSRLFFFSFILFLFRKINTQAQLNSLNAHTLTHSHTTNLLRKRAAWRHSRPAANINWRKEKRRAKKKYTRYSSSCIQNEMYVLRIL